MKTIVSQKEHFLLQLFLILYTLKQIYAFGEKKMFCFFLKKEEFPTYLQSFFFQAVT